MIYREAIPSDIKQMFIVRYAVKENILLSTDLVTTEITADYLTRRGKGWVCEIDNHITGFSIIDLIDHSVWALFVHPEHESKGIGRKLHELMLDWYFSQTDSPISLETSAGTRAEGFYLKTGWTPVGCDLNSVAKFKMNRVTWFQNL